MKAVVVRAIVAALLLGASWVCWRASQLQTRLTEANRQVLMLRYSGSVGEYDEIEQSVAYAGRFATNLLPALHARRATAEYWGNLSGGSSLVRDANGESIEKDPEVLFLAANAAYRAGQRSDVDRLATVRTLDAVISTYADVLRKDPGILDAAYNYEFAARARDAAARGFGALRAKPGAPASPPAAGQKRVPGGGTADLPAGPTIHGHPGGPPSGSDMSKFKVLAPQRPDERQATPDKAGENKPPPRRG